MERAAGLIFRDLLQFAPNPMQMTIFSLLCGAFRGLSSLYGFFSAASRSCFRVDLSKAPTWVATTLPLEDNSTL